MTKPLIVVAGPVATRSGYGAHTRDICTALINSDKYDVRIASLPWGGTPNNALPFDSPLTARIIQGNQLERQPDVFIQVTIPNEFQRNGKYNIGITAGIETDTCHSTWIEGCNRMDLVLATSEHSRNVFYNTKATQGDKQIQLDKACEVLFEGIDTAVFNKMLPKDPEIVATLDDIKEEFCFLFVGHWLQGMLGQDRKDVGMLVRTFFTNFAQTPAKSRPALILKTSAAGFSEIEKEDILNKLEVIASGVRKELGVEDLPNVYVLHGDLTDSQMNTLYNHTKVKSMVSYTKGEGFGRPFLEFSTTGKPLIVSNWSGQTDFLTAEHSILLPGKVAPVHGSTVNDWILKDSKWFTVDYAIAGATLKDVFKNYSRYAERSKKTAGIAAKKWTLAQMQTKLEFYVDRALEVVSAPAAPLEIKLPTLKRL